MRKCDIMEIWFSERGIFLFCRILKCLKAKAEEAPETENGNVKQDATEAGERID